MQLAGLMTIKAPGADLWDNLQIGENIQMEADYG